MSPPSGRTTRPTSASDHTRVTAPPDYWGTPLTGTSAATREDTSRRRIVHVRPALRLISSWAYGELLAHGLRQSIPPPRGHGSAAAPGRAGLRWARGDPRNAGAALAQRAPRHAA